MLTKSPSPSTETIDLMNIVCKILWLKQGWDDIKKLLKDAKNFLNKLKNYPIYNMNDRQFKEIIAEVSNIYPEGLMLANRGVGGIAEILKKLFCFSSLAV